MGNYRRAEILVNIAGLVLLAYFVVIFTGNGDKYLACSYKDKDGWHIGFLNRCDDLVRRPR